MNKVILMGRLTADSETRYTQGAEPVAVVRFGVAVRRKYKKEGEPDADFINCAAFGKTGEFISKYFKKGQQVGIIGRIQTRTWDDDQGQKHYITEVIAEEAYFADSKRDGDAGASFENTFGNTAPGNMGDDFEVSSSDDLPF